MEAFQRLQFGVRRKLPMIHQTEAAECGLACVAMIASYFGNHVDLPDIRQLIGLSTKGARLTDLIRVSDRLAMVSRAVRVDLNELHQLTLPCILHWDLNHFVVLRQLTRDAVVIHDPGFGVRRIPFATMSRHFTGVALELTPGSGFQQKAAQPRLRLRDALGKVVGLRQSMSLIFIMALAIEVLGISIPFYLQIVIDHALVSADQSLLTTLALAFSLVIVTQVVLKMMRGWTLMVMSTSLKVQGRANLFTHLQKLPSAFFESRHIADVLSRFGSLTEIQRALTTDLIEACLDGFFTLLTLAIMFLISPTLTAVVVAGAVCYAVLRIALYTPLREASLEGIIWSAKRDSHFLETLRGIRTIKLLNGEERRRTRWLNLMVESVNRELTVQKLRLLFRSGNSLLIGLLTVLVVWLAASKALSGAFTVGMMVAFLAYMAQFMSRVSALIDMLTDLRMLRLHGERLADIATATPEAQQIQPDAPLRVEPSVELRDIRFRYSDNDPWVLDGVSLKIAAGESVAIVGSSGCGKTTLLKIVASLLQPISGDLLIGGERLAHHGLRNYRRAIGVVLQDDQLLAGSIAENISFFSSRQDRKRVEKCARLAAVHEDIVAMPMGYESLIGDMGTSLSGGQKQRVLLARALYRGPRILLLDEATSHLDVKRERQVGQALARFRMTRIIVAHRPETIALADRVIELANGRIISDSQLERRDAVPATGARIASLGRADVVPIKPQARLR